MKVKSIFWVVLFLGGLIGLLAYWGYNRAQQDLNSTVAESMKSDDEMIGAILVYRDKYREWPKNPDEIRGIIVNDKTFRDVDLSAYQGLSFTGTPDKGLRIRYLSYKNVVAPSGPTQLDVSIQPTKEK